MGNVLTTPEDLFNLGYGLDEMLRMFSNLSPKDAWAEGNTDTAFKFNQHTAVQRTHRSNTWETFGGNLADINRGTFNKVKTDMLHEDNLVTLPPVVKNNGKQFMNNTGNTVMHIDIPGTKSKTIHITLKTSSVIATKFGTFNNDFTYKDFTFTDGELKSPNIEKNITTPHNMSISIDPGKNVKYTIQTTTNESHYRLIIPVEIEGYIAKASGSDQGDWNFFVSIEEAFKRRLISYFEYNVVLITTEDTLKIILS
jgi:hypothetical protein